MKRLLVFVFAIMPFLAFATDEICPAGYQPAEYIELEYIETTGTQYIDLHKTALFGSNSFRILASVSTTYNKVFGALLGNKGGNSGDPGLALYLNTSVSNTIYFSHHAPEYKVKVPEFYDGTFHTVEAIYDGNGVGGYIIDGINQYTSDTINKNSVDNGKNYYVFKNGSSFYFRGKTTYLIVSSDNNLIFYLIPARRLSDGVVGMFDKINNKFYTNIGTGEFIAGPEVSNQHYICVPCPPNTYKPNSGNAQCIECPTGTFSPIGSTQLSDCAKILHVGEYVVYMPLGKRTEHGLCVMVDNKKYCADVYERQ